jgi:hypothetical protein
MGNTPSSEQARRTPQRLSKPRIGQLTTSSNLLSPEAASAPNLETRLPDLHLAGPPPVPALDTKDTLPAEFHALSSEQVTRADAGVEDERPTSPPEQDVLQVPRFATSPLPPDSVSRSKSTGILPSGIIRALPRPKSAILRSETSPLTVSVGLGDKPSRRQSHYDLGSTSGQTILSTSPREYRGFSPVIGSGAAQFDGGLSNGQDATESQEPGLEASVGSPRSETTLYAPARRRSAIQTPGVATRSATDPNLNKKKSYRKSLSAASEASRPRSSESKPRRRTSMPPNPSTLDLPEDLPERGATPTESPFRQLGGMKFGSLHIVNGTPITSPRSETRQSMLSAEIARDDTPGSSDYARETATDPSAGIGGGNSESNQPTPMTGGLSPAAAMFGEPSTSAAETPSDSRCSPFTPTKSEEMSPWTQPSSNDDGEMLEIGQYKNGQLTTSNSSKPQTPTTSSDGVARSDSGNGSVSSAKSQAAASKADSGYGSSLSLKSLFGSRKKAKQAKEERERRAAAKTESTAADSLDRRPTLRHHSPFKPNDQADESTGADQPGVTQAQAAESVKKARRQSGLGFGARLGSFKAKKSKETKEQMAQPAEELPQINITQQEDTPSPMMDSSEAQDSTEVNHENQKARKLKKLINNPRRRSMPIMPGRDDDLEAIPSMPSDAEAKLQEHSRNFDRLSKRFSLRLDPSKDRPDSLIHVESKEVTDEAVAHDITPPVEQATGPLPSSREHDKPSRTASVRSFRPPSVRRLRRPRQVAGDPYDSDDDSPHDYVAGYESQVASIATIRRSVGNSPFDAAFVALATDNTHGIAPHAAPGPRPGPPMRPKTPTNPGQFPRLRPRRSAPDFLETVSEPASPGSIDCWSQKKPKTPPPVTIRTRGSKKKRRPKSMQAGGRPPQQHPPLPGHFMPMPHGDHGGPYGYNYEQDLTQSLRSFPPSQTMGYGPPRADPYHQQAHGPPPGRRPSAARPLYPPMGDEHTGRYPPLQQQAGLMPPFHPTSPRGCAGPDQRGERRVLHSYDSPAYKGVPIWG